MLQPDLSEMRRFAWTHTPLTALVSTCIMPLQIEYDFRSSSLQLISSSPRTSLFANVPAHLFPITKSKTTLSHQHIHRPVRDIRFPPDPRHKPKSTRRAPVLLVIPGRPNSSATKTHDQSFTRWQKSSFRAPISGGRSLISRPHIPPSCMCPRSNARKIATTSAVVR
jgi:hypothetical protein